MASVTNFPRIAKAPDTMLDYTVDWSKWLEQTSGDTVESAAWTLSSVDISIPVDPLFAPYTSPASATIWLEGGMLDQNYNVTCQITTVAGRTEDYTFTLVCQNL